MECCGGQMGCCGGQMGCCGAQHLCDVPQCRRVLPGTRTLENQEKPSRLGSLVTQVEENRGARMHILKSVETMTEGGKHLTLDTWWMDSDREENRRLHWEVK